MSSPKTVVVADFDETLVHDNTLLPLYGKLVTTSLAWVAVKALIRAEWLTIGPHRAIKAQMYREILGGRKEKEICSAATGLASLVSVNFPALAKIREYTRQGAEFVVATASLETFVRILLEEKRIDVNRIIGTKAAGTNGVYNGELSGGECVGRLKAERVRNVLKRHYEDYRAIAFGNLPADRAMMEFADCAFVVDGGRIVPFR